ncbi:XkdX family protein [Bacillus subtilis]|uniref:XkdX family protein n=1 Tax=Bacillati TaxID=1783272 RepID=UPI000D0E1C2B|nr:XkdX family protein [Bacillus subtilis]MBJ3768829.1 XkdX family protein [Bacillus subtilis]MEC0292331.1 XkdX family protein [Bacillus subtilis]MEC0338216.1 XkdX family protein [Bacillus subtilis]MEC0366739.1 XkdX family protein [Bacillus subtilis]MEC0402811.1 XkdX family protein [Bacillus subtilis]
MSDWYETIKDYYDDKLWTPEMVRDMIPILILTPEEYQEITGFIYPATEPVVIDLGS